MRNNNGVQEYASDTSWHTKIANIAKGSERCFMVAANLGEADSSSQTAAIKDVKEVKI